MLGFNGCSNTPETSKDKVADETKNSLDSKIMVESISDWILLLIRKPTQLWMPGLGLIRKLYRENGKLSMDYSPFQNKEMP